ncbi:hypothetical protein VTK73DRAFT_9524 [Phialemonium thermophilum]|uniref:Endonuclease/exonuclease/phosphatase domain-containing protein n=1 Tax=Phialemonium thermophilum TaxID=223376 RepID=A0ABR3XKV1_9PEZI
MSAFEEQLRSAAQQTKLPPGLSNERNIQFQSWNVFDAKKQTWTCVVPTASSSFVSNESSTTAATAAGAAQMAGMAPLQRDATRFTIVTWNVDGFTKPRRARMRALLAYILDSPPDILFLQEVCREALDMILSDSRVRAGWFISDTSTDDSAWHGVPFATLTLLARSRFANSDGYGDSTSDGQTATLGSPLWRVSLPSRYGRDALCCDILVQPTKALDGTHEAVPVRLLNVHLDSLPARPSLRPRQLAIAAALLRAVALTRYPEGKGLVAGDFNPVQREDQTLVEECGLVDAWTALHSETDDPGFTWGVDGQQRFPPNRMDKVALLGLQPMEMEVLHPGSLEPRWRRQMVASGGSQEDDYDEEEEDWEERDARQNTPIPWSDHSGLRLLFRLNI